jgi:hypothetical protein
MRGEELWLNCFYTIPAIHNHASLLCGWTLRIPQPWASGRSRWDHKLSGLWWWEDSWCLCIRRRRSRTQPRRLIFQYGEPEEAASFQVLHLLLELARQNRHLLQHDSLVPTCGEALLPIKTTGSISVERVAKPLKIKYQPRSLTVSTRISKRCCYALDWTCVWRANLCDLQRLVLEK